MKTLYRIFIIMLMAVFACSCDIIATRSISDGSEENNDQNSNVENQTDIQKQPYDYSKELEKRLDNEAFACYYRFMSDVYVTQLSEPIGWRNDIDYNDKISFGYCSKIKEGYDKCIADYAGRVRVHIALDKNYPSLINEWLAQNNLSYSVIEEMEAEWERLSNAREVEQAYYIEKEIDAYYEQIELAIKNGYYDLLAPLLNGKFQFSLNDEFIGTFDNLEECNNYLEVLNQISTNEYVRTISIVYDFGELVSKQLYLSYFAEYYANLRRYYEEHNLYYNVIEDQYGEDVHYIRMGFVFVENESWLAAFFYDTEKLKGFLPIA